MVASDAARYGTDWTADEIAVCVAEYFLMLAQEQAGRPYVKADHWRRVMGQTGRRKGSVEFKFGNISAVLEELSVPWVWGYKPAHNYQNALVEAVERQLIDHAGFFEPSAAFTPSSGQFAEGLFVDPPKLKAKEPADIIPAMRQLIRKFDPAARDYRNRMLGKAGEKFVLDYERDNLERAGCSKLAGKVRWVSNEDGDGTATTFCHSRRRARSACSRSRRPGAMRARRSGSRAGSARSRPSTKRYSASGAYSISATNRRCSSFHRHLKSRFR